MAPDNQCEVSSLHQTHPADDMTAKTPSAPAAWRRKLFGEQGVTTGSLPICRTRTRIFTDAVSPFKRKCSGSPLMFSSPSRIESLFRHSTWIDIKGHLGPLLGRGGFGSVYRTYVHGYELAVKKMRYTLLNRQTVLKSLQSEKLALHLRHKNIVTVYKVNDKYEPTFIIMEYVGTNTLQRLLDQSSLEKQLLYKLARDVAAALEFIHRNNIVHLDVKPSNVLVSCTHTAKLGDFGCSQLIQDSTEGYNISPTNRSDITGTVAYRAPELLRGCCPSTKADLYAYGVLLWQMMTRRYPYAGENTHVVIFAVVAQGLRPSFSSLDEEDGLSILCEQCWRTDPLERLSAHQVYVTLNNLIEHPKNPNINRATNHSESNNQTLGSTARKDSLSVFY